MSRTFSITKSHVVVDYSNTALGNELIRLEEDDKSRYYIGDIEVKKEYWLAQLRKDYQK